MSDANAAKSWAIEAAFCRSLFEYTPISLWEMDYGQIKIFFDELKSRGVTDLDEYLEQNADVLSDCMHSIRVLDVNRKSIELFLAHSKEQLIQNRVVIFRDELVRHFQEELVDLWNQRFEYEREGICYTLSGEPMDVSMRWVVLPGCEENFSHILVAVTDITARKRAEDHLKFLTHHDPLTSLHNRYCYEEELSRLENSRRFPVTIVLAELLGLKDINNRLGTSTGNSLLCRAGEVLKAAFRSEDIVARTSGHQFAVILPQTDENAADRAIERIDNLVRLNNEFYQGPALVFAISQATGRKGCNLQEIHQEAERKLPKGLNPQ
ncbi:MAG: GGDEF domain-containing protein [Chloroflexota bacterium]